MTYPPMPVPPGREPYAIRLADAVGRFTTNPIPGEPMPNHHTAADQPGALARGVLKTQLETARDELATDQDLVDVYIEQRDAGQARVAALEAAIADLDASALRTEQLERTITGADQVAGYPGQFLERETEDERQAANGNGVED